MAESSIATCASVKSCASGTTKLTWSDITVTDDHDADQTQDEAEWKGKRIHSQLEDARVVHQHSRQTLEDEQSVLEQAKARQKVAETEMLAAVEVAGATPLPRQLSDGNDERGVVDDELVVDDNNTERGVDDEQEEREIRPVKGSYSRVKASRGFSRLVDADIVIPEEGRRPQLALKDNLTKVMPPSSAMSQSKLYVLLLSATLLGLTAGYMMQPADFALGLGGLPEDGLASGVSQTLLGIGRPSPSISSMQNRTYSAPAFDERAPQPPPLRPPVPHLRPPYPTQPLAVPPPPPPLAVPPPPPPVEAHELSKSWLLHHPNTPPASPLAPPPRSLLPPPPRTPVPMPPPPPLPPYGEWTGPLTSARCDAMIRNPSHLFRRMWAAEAWGRMEHGACWDSRRDDASKQQPSNVYFDETFWGTHCSMNWFEGNAGELGKPGRPPGFSDDAPAMIGFDESINRVCGGSNGADHAPACVSCSPFYPIHSVSDCSNSVAA